VALRLGDVSSKSGPVLVRIHSQCLTGDVFHSLRCDCRAQLELALDQIAQEGRGLVVYENQEGRGIGLMNKLRAYELQDGGLDTVEANERLGFKADLRDYALPAAVIRWFGIDRVRLLSNNPEKLVALESTGIRVIERAPIVVPPLATTAEYLRTKKEKMGHLF
jgi:GTP cyclohydrolase II